MTRHLSHPAFFYEGREEYLGGLVPFIEEGLRAEEPVFVAVPGPNLELVRGSLGDGAERVSFLDMTGLGRNPGRIIPAIRRFVDEQAAGGAVRFIGEPIWPGRSPAETAEATRHEALLNLAFGRTPMTILCPYDTAGLPREVVDDARRTHPELVIGGRRRPSREYAGWSLLADDGPPAGAPEAEDGPVVGTTAADLARLRQFVAGHAEGLGVGADRVGDLMVAVTEVATNALRHAGSPSTVRVWHDEEAMVCELSDGGRIADPLAGRHPPAADAECGRGLWLVNQLCDLVEMRSGQWGTNIRLRVALN